MLRATRCPASPSRRRSSWSKVGPGAFRIIDIDGSHGGTGPGILADWISRGYEGYMPLGWYFSDPGAKVNSSRVRDALDASIGR